jgi:hypothetical protein
MFEAKVVEKLKTHILRSVTFFPVNRAVYGITWKNIVQPATGMAHAHCLLDT